VKETFTRQQWIEYTCGTAPVELRVAIEDHTASCEDCRATSRMLADVDRELIAAVTVLRDSFSGLESAGERAYERWRQERLPAWETDHLSRRIVRLQLFLAPICGFGTTERAMVAAAARSAADSVELLTEIEWPAFVKHLSSIVGALCGEPSGHLLWHIGQPMVLELS
jgi:predicted anti-sigma-YlaC factor YlaD